ncbi:NPC intracellular cholesterol transporter 1-like [Sycon ciliatum]|uniref:NPC intracellular cholesterol transporter 1-like n=1 Tax=Sycon ciliatum TaxID=27933 RepID=UPI0031F6EED5
MSLGYQSTLLGILGSLLLLAIYVVPTTQAEPNEGRCIWYGVCSANKKQYCPYNGTAKVLKEQQKGAEALHILKKVCPWMYAGEATRLCCDYDQLYNLQDGVQKLSAIFGGCPSCLNNFRRLFCSYTCDKNQSTYMRIAATKSNNATGQPRTSVTNVTIAVEAAPLSATFNSCANILYNGHLATIAVCHLKKTSPCPEALFWHSMGSMKENPFFFSLLSSGPEVQGLRPRTFPTIACTEAAPGQLYSCPCQTCPARTDCKSAPVKPLPKKQSFVVSIDGVTFIMGCIFIAFLFTFSVFITYKSASPRTLTSTFLLDSTSINGGSAVIATAGQRGDKLRRKIDAVLGGWCHSCARNPFKVLVLSLTVAGLLCCGIVTFKVITDPVALWSAPNGEFRHQKNIFDKNFGPFYRTQMLIVTLDDGPELFNRFDEAVSAKDVDQMCEDGEVTNYTIGQVFRRGVLEKVLELQEQISNISVNVDSKRVTLEDICFAPLSPDNDKCATETVLQYFQNNITHLRRVKSEDFLQCVTDSYIDHMMECTFNPLETVSQTDGLNLPCLGDFGGPAYPNVVLGGYGGVSYMNATALVVTYLVNNHVDAAMNKPAEEWEKRFLETVESFNKTVSFYTKQQCHLFKNCNHSTSMATVNLNVAYSAQRSIADEVSRESTSDVVVLGLSYMLMFMYVAITLGKISFSHPATLLINSKVSLALAGVLLVLLAVAASVGTLALLGVDATLIVFEAVPFLVLAVGVDNLFLMVQALQRDERIEGEEISAQVGRVLSAVAPSLTLSALAESVAFFCGALSDIPAVRSFSLYAGLAVLFNYFLQMTAFIAFLSLDARRQDSQRMDIFCCFPGGKKNGYINLEAEDCSPGCLYRIFSSFYAPALLHKFVRPVVVCAFFGVFFMSIVATTHLEIGLDQTTALPKDSYLVPYFGNLSRYVKVGAPVYFVVDGEYPYNDTNYAAKICSTGGNCSRNSLVQQLNRASQHPEVSTIAQPPLAWLDSYYEWITPATACCRLKNSTASSRDSGLDFCPPTDQTSKCIDCLPDGKTLPTRDEFDDYIEDFLHSNPSAACPAGGHAAFSSALSFANRSANDNRDTAIKASHFMTYHTPANDSATFINALKQARDLADKMTAAIDYPGIKVFPYSVFYVFYGQYLNIVKSAAINLTVATVALFIISYLMLGLRVRQALFILGTVWMIIVDVMGVMYLWDIKFNAISLVNLVVAMGIAVEFCVHICNTFCCIRTGTRLERARSALITTGSSVLSGITLTKFGGVAVLAFTSSKLFQVYYFRMYMSIVCVGAAHGLIFLPALLSYIG